MRQDIKKPCQFLNEIKIYRNIDQLYFLFIYRILYLFQG